MTVTRLVVDGENATIGLSQSGKPSLTSTLKTSERVLLLRPIAPRDSVVLDIDWHFEVPLDTQRSALRLGRFDNRVFQVAQWYPRIAVLDDLNGWDTTSYTGPREFYNSFSQFDVELKVPGGWPVGATGELQNAGDVLSARTRSRLAAALAGDSVVLIGASGEPGITAADSILVWRFVADSVSDFAWGASPEYSWHANSVGIPGRGRILAQTFLLTADARDVANRIRHDLPFNSSLLVPYPFPQLTLIDGPEGGMEYPMLVMSGGDDRLSHELWHLWFPMTVGTNETLYPFLDEGFATFLARITEAARQGRPYAPTLQRGSRTGPLIWPDDRGPPDLIASIGYSKPAAMFAALFDIAGREPVLAALKDYASAWSFRHPSPWDFMFSMNRSLGRNLDAFWYRWIFSIS